MFRESDRNHRVSNLAFQSQNEDIIGIFVSNTVNIYNIRVNKMLTFIIARIRSTREGNVFTLFICPHLGSTRVSGPGSLPNLWSPVLSGGTPASGPISDLGEYPSPSQGVPCSGWGVPQNRVAPLVRTGLVYPQPGQEWGTPIQNRTGLPAQPGLGSPPRGWLPHERYASYVSGNTTIHIYDTEISSLA